MSQHAANLGRAAQLIKRIADIGGPNEFEGVAVSDIVADVLLAQNHAYMELALHRQGLRPFVCDVDESAGMAEIVDLHDFSRKVGA